MTAIFVIAAVAVLFTMAAWAAGTAYRLYAPETPQSYELDRSATTSAHILPRKIPVGARDIREAQRRVLTVRSHVRYVYSDGYSRGVPDLWLQDLHVRRN